MRFLVGADGTVRDSIIQSTSGSGILDQVALDGLSKCHFSPGLIDGNADPEPQWTVLKYTWSIEPTK